MGNTEPVVIQDKNGKTTTVHRRTSATSAGVGSAPAPSLPSPTMDQMSNDEIVHLFEDRASSKRFVSVYRFHSREYVNEAMDFFREDSPAAFSEAVRLMTSGTRTAQEYMKGTVSGVVASIAQACEKRAKGEDDWDAWLPGELSLRRDFAYRWAAGNAVEEYGFAAHQLGKVTYESYIEHVSGLCDSISASLALVHGQERDEENATEFWRGVAALAITEVLGERFRRSEPLPNGGPEFVAWAGQQEDLTDAIEVVRERKILHPESIQEVLSQKNSTTKAINNGVL